MTMIEGVTPNVTRTPPGLGDPDESRDDDTYAAVAELLAEARALRSVAS